MKRSDGKDAQDGKNAQDGENKRRREFRTGTNVGWRDYRMGKIKKTGKNIGRGKLKTDRIKDGENIGRKDLGRGRREYKPNRIQD